MNPDSLCAKCAHLMSSHTPGNNWHYCEHRNSMQLVYSVVCIDKGFKTCINFKPRKEQSHNLYNQIEEKLEEAMEMLMKLREQNPSENLAYAEDSLDEAISFLHSFEDEQLVYRKGRCNSSIQRTHKEK